MKTVKVILVVLALLVLPVQAFSALGNVRVSLLEGDVQIKTPEAGEWIPASINTPLNEGDELWVPEGGRVELQLNTGTYVRLDQNSALQILTVESKSSQFYLTQGHAYVDFNAPRGSVIQIDTPASSVRAFDRSVFRVDVSDQFTDVSVYKGSVEAEDKNGKTRVNAGKTLALGEGADAELAPLGEADDWEKWNRERDKKLLARRDSHKYLPEELNTYSTDFDDNGEWVEAPEYGRVWRPTVAVGVDWAPYRSGRWIWRGGDYVWVGYEPWGWAPYHYGRWAFAVNVGWFWVPPVRGQVFWGPGYVGWVRTADHVAWVPLAPREIYYGHGYYGPHSVNITKVRVNLASVNFTFRNVHVNNGITVIHHNTFVTGRPVPVNVTNVNITKNIFIQKKINIGRPDIRPERTSYVPVVKTIQPAKLPPQTVTRVEIKQVKKERILIKEQNKSVIHRGAPVKTLAVKELDKPKSPAEKMKERKQMPQEKGKTLPAGEEKDRRVKPEGRERPGAPTGGPEGKVEEKGKRVKPEGRERPGAPTGGPEGKVEEKGKRVKPEGRERPGAPTGGPEGKVEEKGKRVMPEGRERPGAPAGGPEGKVEEKGRRVKPESRERPGGQTVGPESKPERKGKKPAPEDEEKQGGPGAPKDEDRPGKGRGI